MTSSGALRVKVDVVRSWLTGRLIWAGVLWGLLAVQITLLCAWVLVGKEGWHLGTRVPVLLDLLLLATVGLIALWLRDWSRREFSEPNLAKHLEVSAGLPPGTVRGPLELSAATPPGVSDSLARLGEEWADGELSGEPSELSGAIGSRVVRWGRRAGGGGIALSVLMLTLLALAPGRSLDAWRGLVTPVSLAAQPVFPPLQVTPGSGRVVRGEDFPVRILAETRDSVRVSWERAGELSSSLTFAVTNGVASHVFSEVRSDFQYRIDAPDGGAAGPFEVELVDPLILTGVTLRLVFPTHTGLGPTEVVGDPPPLLIPRGTVIEVQGQASRPLSSVALVTAGPDPRSWPFQADGFGFRGQWVPDATGAVRWLLRDEEGREPDEDLGGLDVEIIEDLEPQLRFILPSADTALPVSRRQPLLLEALDDYGVARLELETWRVGSLGRVGDPVEQTIQGGGARDLIFRPVLDVSSWGLLPGDTVKLRAWAVDNRPGGRRSTVAELSLWLPNEDVLRQEAGQEITNAADLLEQLTEDAERLAAEARDLERQAEAEKRADAETDARERAQEGALGFEEREDLRRSLESERNLMASVDSLGEEMGALAENLNEAGLPDAELQRQLEELRALMEEISSDEARAQLDSLSESLDRMEAADATREVENLGERQEQLREQLERALERFQQAAAEQEFRSTTQEAEALAREEELLSQSLKESSDPAALAPRQDELSTRAEDLELRLGDLQEQLSRMGEEESSKEVGEARKEAQEASEDMTRSSEEMSAGDRQQAASSASEASQQMSEAAQRLQQAQQEMAQAEMEALQQAMTQVTADALALARRQGSLQEGMRAAAQSELTELRGEQATILEGLRNMAEQAAVTTSEAPAIGQQLSEGIGQAMRAVQGTVEALERGGRRPGPSPFSASESAVGSLNRIALLAMAGAQSLSNPGPGDPSQQLLEQLQQLAEQQGDLTNQTEAVVPMELSQQAREAQAQQIAEGQEAVAGELGELSQNPGEAEDALGDLQALAEAAEALARELQSGRLDATTVERQEELFHRLLDAGRSLQKDEFADERQSDVPGEILRPPVEALGAEALGGEVIPFPNRTQLTGLSPAQRQLILQYFERLNRRRPTAGRSTGGEL